MAAEIMDSTMESITNTSYPDLSITPAPRISGDDPRPSPAESQMPLKGRQRLLKTLQRISSSPTLVQRGRRRAVSNPYTGRSTLSCVSLAASSANPSFSINALPHPGYTTAPTSSPSTPRAGTPLGERSLPARLVRRDLGAETPNSLRAPVPADFQSGLRSGCVSPLTQVSEAEDYFSRPVARVKTDDTFQLWEEMPYELTVAIFKYLQPKELVRASAVSKKFHQICFDGQLWTSFDASEFYRDIPAASLAKIIVAAGPFVKDLNLRGCIQVEHYQRAEVVANACQNLINATLEGCRNFQRHTLHQLLSSNARLAHLNLTGLTAVNNATCKIIARSCPQLEHFNVTWCTHMDARGVRMVVAGCPKLRDLRAGEIRGFGSTDVMQDIFDTNNLERLVLSGCADLDDAALETLMHGVDPEIDILEDRPLVAPRQLRYLDISRCARLSNRGLQALAYNIPHLEVLKLGGCTSLTDLALEKVLATTSRLRHLDLEELSELTDQLLSRHLAKSPCAPRLEYLALSLCENIGDVGVLPVIRACTGMKTIALDNTRISDLVLAEAVAMSQARSTRARSSTARPVISLRMDVYDCSNVTWTGIREVLSRNAEVRRPPASSTNTWPTYPTEVIALKCYYGWQMTVDEHMKRVLRSDFGAADKLEKKWANYMIANEEAGAAGAGARRRRRRAREAQMMHADEEDDGLGLGRRRRARSGNCTVM